jgi:hypothetical protein
MFICLREMELAEDRLLRHHYACEARERDKRRIIHALSTDRGAPVVLLDKSGAGSCAVAPLRVRTIAPANVCRQDGFPCQACSGPL